jgi:molybdate transport system ATP-binding protein
MADQTLTVEVERRYRRGPTITAAFELDLDVAQTLVLFGPSGSGKTTVLRCLAGLEHPDRGRIAAGDKVWFDSAGRVDLAPQRRRIGYLPQGFALFPHLDVRANITYGMGASSRHDRAARLGELMGLLGLAGLERRRPGELSGGQQQRVALGRALAHKPRLLLLDEPLSALDAPMREQLRLELRQLLLAAGLTAIVVTHDRTEALVLGDRVAVMDQGSICQLGPTLDVFDRPTDETVAHIVGVETVLSATVIEASGGLLRLSVGTAAVEAVGTQAVGTQVLISIRAEDVIIGAAAGESPTAFSARNHLAGRVTAIEPAGSLVRVRLDCGFPLVAAVTRPAIEAMRLAPGAEAVAIFKAPAVHVIG